MFVNEIVNTVDTESFKKFMKNFDGLDYEKSFANNETIKKPLRTNGLVSTYDVLDNLAKYGEAVNDIPEFLEEYGQMEILEDKYDNSYNYSGYLDRYVDFGMFSLENDQVLVTLAVGFGLDPRGGYTNKVAFIFEDEYSFLEIFESGWQLLEFEFTAFNGKKFYASFDGGALSEYGYLSIIDQETGEEKFYDETVLDSTDKEDIKDTINEIMETESVEIDKVNYFWEPNFQQVKIKNVEKNL